MTDNIEWGEPLTGPEIKALGLPGDTPVSADNMPLPLRDWALLSDTPFYRIPADHDAYIVHRYNEEHGTNFVYWAGGDEAPEDWDQMAQLNALWADGTAVQHLHPYWNRRGHYNDIIGYIKKPQLVTEEANEPEMTVNHAYEARMQEQRRIEPETDTFTPCERTVHKLRAEVFAVLRAHEEVSEQCFAEVAMVTQALLPKPDRAEELVNDWGCDGSDVKANLISFARWLIERGEIKG